MFALLDVIAVKFEVKAAVAIGILLPLLETCRRGISHWSVDFSTMFEDYSAGVALLIGAWAVYQRKNWGPLFLVVAWAFITNMMTNSLLDQVERTFRRTENEPYNFLVIVVKFILWIVSVVALVGSFQTVYKRSQETS